MTEAISNKKTTKKVLKEVAGEPLVVVAAKPENAEAFGEPLVMQELKPNKEIANELELYNKDRDELITLVKTEVLQLHTDAQMALLMNETPMHRIRQRKGRGGLTFDYVDVNYVIEQLNYIYGFRWKHEVFPKPKEGDLEGWTRYVDQSVALGQFLVTVELSLPDRNVDGGFITHTEAGRAEIKVTKDTGKPMDIGNDYKAAISDALKRAASRSGIALDVYSGAATRKQDKEHPDGPVTDAQRKRLEVLAGEAGIGHSGLKKVINEMYDYGSTKTIMRKHFTPIAQRLELLVAEGQPEPEMPEDIVKGFDILSTPKAKRIAAWKSYSSKGQEGIDKLKKDLNAEIDRRANPEPVKK